MRKAFLFITVIIACCVINARAHTTETFDSFFKRFSVDAVFQKSRTRFPLKIITIELEADTKYLSKREWKFTDFVRLQKDKKNIFKTLHSGKNSTIIEYQVQDKGILIQHIFKYADGKWWFVELRDMSD